MKRAAIGVRMHSGWGAVVAVGAGAEGVEVLQRLRMVVSSRDVPGAVQPYHFAEKLKLEDAKQFLAERLADSTAIAGGIIEVLLNALADRQYQVAGAAVALAAGRPLPALEKILASHALIHTAEGVFFREVFAEACRKLGIAVTGLRERELAKCADEVFGKRASSIREQIASMGRSIGPPWTSDQKTAALAGAIVLQQTDLRTD